MNFIDIIFCIPLVWGLYKGFTKGLIIEAASILALTLGIWGAIHFSQHVADHAKENFKWESEYLPILSFALVFLAIIVTIFFIAKLLSKAANSIALGGIDKILGAVLGTLKHALILSIIIFIIDAIEKSYPQFSFKAKEESLLYEPIGKIAPIIIPALQDSTLTLNTKVIEQN